MVSEENSTKLPETATEAVRGLDLAGKTFLITGGYSGLGAATTAALLSATATVIVAGRNAKSQEAFARELKVQPGTVDAAKTLDLTSLAAVRDFASYVASRYDTIDCLINNAGVMNTPPGRTVDGFEIQMGTNVIGHFLLAKLLAPRTKRQVWMSSNGHALVKDPPGKRSHDYANAPRIDINAITQVDERHYDSWRRYQQSKLGDILLARQFLKEFDHLESCVVHPGVVRTKLGRHSSTWQLLKFVWAAATGSGTTLSTPERGARTQTLCAVMPSKELVYGGYYADCVVAKDADCARNMDDAKRLYDYCDEVTRPFQS